MEHNDRALIAQVVDEDAQLRRLYDEHQLLERRLEKLIGRRYLTPADELLIKRLKVKKLQGVDQMMRILASYRSAQHAV